MYFTEFIIQELYLLLDTTQLKDFKKNIFIGN